MPEKSIFDEIKDIKLDASQQNAFDKITKSDSNFFIQGQAGTGKSMLIKHVIAYFEKTNHKYAVVAPTGIAAQLIGGSTIHSLFCLGGKPFFPLNIVEEYKKYDELVEIIETLIIDEVSMLRADILDTINILCQKAKKNNSVFGGIQVILVGDLNQLPPVYKNNPGQQFDKKYEQGPKEYMLKTYQELEPFFFDATCYNDANFSVIKLTQNHRQENDTTFLENLNIICQKDEDKLDDALAYFNRHVVNASQTNYNIPIVTGRRSQAEYINNHKLEELNGQERLYQGVFGGEFYTVGNADVLKRRKEDTIVPEYLKLKVGAQVMFCVNSPDENYVNGTIGIVKKLGDDEIEVEIKTDKQIEKNVKITKHSWKEHKYVRDGDELRLKEIGVYEQFPLKLAYAVTIHKSQGQTWDNVLIDLGEYNAFAAGQLYVALSRVKTGAGVNLARKIEKTDIIVNRRVQQFLNGETPEHTEYKLDSCPNKKDEAIAFWRSLFPDMSEIYTRFANKGTNCNHRNSFWFTIPNDKLNTGFYLICSDARINKTSKLFFIRPDMFQRCDFDIDWTAKRYEPRTPSPNQFFEVCISDDQSDNYKELIKKSINFKECLISEAHFTHPQYVETLINEDNNDE